MKTGIPKSKIFFLTKLERFSFFYFNGYTSAREPIRRSVLLIKNAIVCCALVMLDLTRMCKSSCSSWMDFEGSLSSATLVNYRLSDLQNFVPVSP